MNQAPIHEDDGWLIGHAARTNHIFTRECDGLGRQMFARGCFQRDLDRVVFGVDHGCCTCRQGYSKTAAKDAYIDGAQVLADTTAGTLRLAEDAYGLFFAAQVPLDASVGNGDGPLINIHEAVAAGRCRGLSIHGHGGEHVIRNGVFAYVRFELVEISLCLSAGAGSPGTWVAAGDAAALDRRETLAEAARTAGTTISETP